MDDILSEFLAEAFENLNVLDAELVRLEKNEGDPELIGRIFRIMHSIKGTCGFLGLPRLETVAHAAENVLGKLREGELEASPTTISPVLAALDRVKLILDTLAASHAEPVGDDSDVVAQLDAALGGVTAPLDHAIRHQALEPAIDQVPARADRPETTASSRRPRRPRSAAAAKPVKLAQMEAAPTACTPPPPANGRAPVVAVAAEGDAPGTKQEGAPHVEAVSAQSLRVPVEILEKLMTLVGELVLTRNQLLQMTRNNGESAFKASLQRLSHITSELQEGVMKTRMQPIGAAWSKLPRLVRDLSVELGKGINLEMLGSDTELDRQVLELIKDPLTHMVRNSADHGLEGPSERRAAGKSEQGTIVLNAFHEGGHIVIEISDDGRGLDLDRIRRKAVAQGLVSEAEAQDLSPQQVMRLIFKAGLSTAEAITNVSGRGVGMDVVRANIEQIGGSIEIHSEVGRGTSFTVKIPLTLAIVPALIVSAGNERFAVPQIGVVELVRVGPRAEHRVEAIAGATILRLRDRLLPLVSLGRILGLGTSSPIPTDTAYVIVAQVGTFTFGLAVDQVFDTEEIVVKPIAPILKFVSVYSGNTILGDGSVAMILDFNSLADFVDTEATATATLDTGATKRDTLVAEETMSLLLFEAGVGAPKAVPMALVTRLEQISTEAIEWAGDQAVTQYRGKLMPLASVDGNPIAIRDGRRPVLVFSDGERTMGLVVDRVVDTIETRVALERQGGHNGVLGSAIIAGKSTELLDVGYLVNRVFGGWFGGREHEPFRSVADDPKSVLLVDDSPFIRNLMAPLLRAEGYRVTLASSPIEALRLRDAGTMFDAVVSDIEMPEMDGFAFAAACRASGPWRETPFIALTSHVTPQDIGRSRGAGFDHHVGKLEKDGLFKFLAATTSHPRKAA